MHPADAALARPAVRASGRLVGDDPSCGIGGPAPGPSSTSRPWAYRAYTGPTEGRSRQVRRTVWRREAIVSASSLSAQPPRRRAAARQGGGRPCCGPAVKLLNGQAAPAPPASAHHCRPAAVHAHRRPLDGACTASRRWACAVGRAMVLSTSRPPHERGGRLAVTALWTTSAGPVAEGSVVWPGQHYGTGGRL